MSPVSLVERLTELADAQRAAAVALDVDTVSSLTAARADTLFELEVAMRRGWSEEERASIRERLPALRVAEARLANVVGTVAAAVRPPTAAPVYGRGGRLRAR